MSHCSVHLCSFYRGFLKLGGLSAWLVGGHVHFSIWWTLPRIMGPLKNLGPLDHPQFTNVEAPAGFDHLRKNFMHLFILRNRHLRAHVALLGPFMKF